MIKTRISLRQSIYISKRVSFLLDAGISLPNALSLIARQMKKRGAVLEHLSNQISHGQSITAVISKSGIFGTSAMPMIKIGEESGTLAESFSALSDELEKRALLKQKIVGAILYPACITVGMLVLVIVLMTVVFPKMLGVFESLRVTLPLSTRLLMWASDVVRHYGILIAIFIFGLVILGFVTYRRFYSIHKWVDGIFLRLPLLSAFVRAYTLASLSNVIGLLLTNHASLVTSLSVAAETSGNYAYREALAKIVKQISDGEPLGFALAGFPRLFSREYCDLVSIGEQTGKLSETFTYAHTLYARDVDMLTKSLSSSIEPVLMVGIGLAIGVVAFSVVSPMYSITSHLHAT